MRNRKNWLRAGLFWCIALYSLTAAGQDPRLIESAKKEGVVTCYTGSNLVTMRAVAEAFEQKYAPIKVQVTQNTSERLVNRIRAEKATGKLFFDVMNSSLIPLLVSAGVLTPYDSPERKAYGARLKDSQSLWTSMTSNYFVLGYHLRFLSPGQAPKDWWDHLNSRWKGKLGMDPESSGRFHSVSRGTKRGPQVRGGSRAAGRAAEGFDSESGGPRSAPGIGQQSGELERAGTEIRRVLWSTAVRNNAVVARVP